MRDGLALEDKLRTPYGVWAAWCQNLSGPDVRLSFWMLEGGYLKVPVCPVTNFRKD